MSFCSQTFLLFFVLVFSLYWALPWQRARVWLLLGASFYFYSCWNHWLACLIVFSTTIDYFLARGIEATRSPSLRRLFLTVNVVGNLGLLCSPVRQLLSRLLAKVAAGGRAGDLPAGPERPAPDRYFVLYFENR